MPVKILRGALDARKEMCQTRAPRTGSPFEERRPRGAATRRTILDPPRSLGSRWGHSSAGRALAWHARGRRFDPAWLHQRPAANLLLPLSEKFARFCRGLARELGVGARPRRNSAPFQPPSRPPFCGPEVEFPAGDRRDWFEHARRPVRLTSWPWMIGERRRRLVCTKPRPGGSLQDRVVLRNDGLRRPGAAAARAKPSAGRGRSLSRRCLRAIDHRRPPRRSWDPGMRAGSSCGCSDCFSPHAPQDR